MVEQRSMAQSRPGRCFWGAAVACAAMAGALLSVGESGAQSAPRVNGGINTLVFNAVSGKLATGMVVELFEVKGAALRKLSEATLDVEGRADMMTGQPLAIGGYELRFHVADYFHKQGVAVGDPPFIDYVPVRFSVDTPNGHYHVPLACSPWSFSTYRGS